jgi:hypothetical protein
MCKYVSTTSCDTGQCFLIHGPKSAGGVQPNLCQSRDSSYHYIVRMCLWVDGWVSWKNQCFTSSKFLHFSPHQTAALGKSIMITFTSVTHGWETLYPCLHMSLSIIFT